MKHPFRTFLFILFFALLAFSSYKLLYALLDYQKGSSAYKTAEEISGLKAIPKPSVSPRPSNSPDSGEDTADTADTDRDVYAQYLKELDFQSLTNANSDIIGWIMIPNTRLSYPLLQGKDNSYYLNHMYNKETGSVGSVFMDYRLPSDLSGYNTIIYGHRMKDGSMFASLKYYLDSSYRREHPYIYIANTEGIYQYTVFSAYEGATDGLSYQCVFDTDKEKQQFIDYALKHSCYPTELPEELSTKDSYLTLSTCTGNGYSRRMVVQAVLTSFLAKGEG